MDDHNNLMESFQPHAINQTERILAKDILSFTSEYHFI